MFILKATLTAEQITEKEFDRPSIAQDYGMVNDTANLPQLTDRQRKDLEAINNDMVNGMVDIQANDHITVPELATLLNVSEKTTRRGLYVLHDINLIQYVGSNRSEHQEVKQKIITYKMADSSFNCNHHDREQMSKLYTIGETVTFQCGNMQKEGTILIVDSFDVFGCHGSPSYDILVENENMLYKHVEHNLIVSSNK